MSHDDVAVQRWLIFGLALSTTAATSTRLLAIFRFGGMSIIEVALLLVFAILFFFIATSFWIACLGAHTLWRHKHLQCDDCAATDLARLPLQRRTALLVPVYHEDITEVSARIRAMQESLRRLGAEDFFDFFVLSDSRDESYRLAERAVCLELRRRTANCRLFYRNRERNTRHKSGNVEDFCKNWGTTYDYIVVLDADSLMTGRTLIRLVNAMEANPRAALIQTQPLLIGGSSLFARSQQFASWIYGPMYAAGLARLQGSSGNYWGHNAIIRVRPFMENCGLPTLPGRAPLGGEILSHDFVEAALLLRAGWEVWMFPEPGGSYETSPPTFIDHLKRDRRWCQGNLQHIKLLFAQGLRAPSRFHFAMGVMSYLSSPLWFLLIFLFAAHAFASMYIPPATFVGRYPVLAWPTSHTIAFVSVGIATAALLYLPKFLALAVVLRNKNATRACGGRTMLTVSALLEILFSTLIAPIFMLSHSWFVINILAGRKIQWGPQSRRGRGTALLAAMTAFFPHTIVAMIFGAAAWYLMPADIWWYLPLLAGLFLAIPIGWLTSLPSLGAIAQRFGLFLIPSETAGLPIAARVEKLASGAIEANATTDDARRAA